MISIGPRWCDRTALPPALLPWMFSPESTVSRRQDDRDGQECLFIRRKVQRCQFCAAEPERRRSDAAIQTADDASLRRRSTLVDIGRLSHDSHIKPFDALFEVISRICHDSYAATPYRIFDNCPKVLLTTLSFGQQTPPESGQTRPALFSAIGVSRSRESGVGEVANQRHAAQPSATTPVDASRRARPHGRPAVPGRRCRRHACAHRPGGRQAAGRRPVSVLHYHRYSCADWSSLTAMLQDFVAQLARRRMRRCADSSPLRGGLCRLRAGRRDRQREPAVAGVDPRDPRRSRHPRLAVINDFEAVAYATQFIDADETRPIIEAAQPAASGPVLVMGPGTGLGSAVLLPGQPRAQVLATEAGQISLAPGNEREIEILRLFRRERAACVVRGCAVRPRPAASSIARCANCAAARRACSTPAEITGAALAGNDAAAVEALEVFCGLLGSFVGDLVLLYGARGGLPGRRDPAADPAVPAGQHVRRTLLQQGRDARLSATGSGTTDRARPAWCHWRRRLVSG